MLNKIYIILICYIFEILCFYVFIFDILFWFFYIDTDVIELFKFNFNVSSKGFNPCTAYK